MRTKRRLVFVAALIGAGVWWWLAAAPLGAPGAGLVGGDGVGGDGVGGVRPVAVAAEANQRDTAPPEPVATERVAASAVGEALAGGHRIRVLRDDGSPEPLAALELVPVGRAVAVRTLREAAWSDAEQAYLVPLAALRSESGAAVVGSLRARAASGVSSAAPIPATAASEPWVASLTLHATVVHTVHVRVRDTGAAMPGLTVRLSRASMLLGDVAELSGAPGGTASAVYVASTDAAGRAVFGDLVAGSYEVRLDAPRPWAAASGSPRVDIVASGGETVFELAPMIAAGLRIEGGTVISYNARPRNLSMRDVSQEHLVAEKQRIERTWRDCAAFVGLDAGPYARRPGVARPPAEVWFKVLVAGHGWVEETVECRPVSADWAPHVVDVTGLPPTMDFVSVRLEPKWSRPEAIEAAWLPALAFESGGQIPDMSLAVAWRADVLVPRIEGRWKIMAPWAKRMPPWRFDPTVDGPSASEYASGHARVISLSFPADRVPVRFVPVDESGDHLAVIDVTWRLGSEEAGAVLTRPDQTPVWLPVGRGEVAVAAEGFVPSTIVVDVQSPGQVIPIQLQSAW